MQSFQVPPYILAIQKQYNELSEGFQEDEKGLRLPSQPLVFQLVLKRGLETDLGYFNPDPSLRGSL